MKQLLNESLPTLHRLKAEGRVDARGEPGRASLAEALGPCGLAGHFRAVVTAAQVGVRKPHPRIFNAALEALGAAPAAAVYVDDEEENVAVAQRLRILATTCPVSRIMCSRPH